MKTITNFTEETFSNWTSPPSTTENEKLKNAERMVKEAINEYEQLETKSIEIFGQGSYANNTNVKLNSDIDINVCFKDAFYYDLPEGSDPNDFEINSPSVYSFEEFRNDIQQSLINKFGSSSVVRGNKSIKILGNSYRVETDVVATWEYRRYSKDLSYISGVMLQANHGDLIENYPKQHIENGKQKNIDTLKRFKRLTRIYKKLRYKMVDDGVQLNDKVSSFLLECLIWNIPNNIFNNNNNWTEILKESIIFLHERTKANDSCLEWGEVSELLDLFSGRKGTRKDVNEFLVQAWNYLGF